MKHPEKEEISNISIKDSVLKNTTKGSCGPHEFADFGYYQSIPSYLIPTTRGEKNLIRSASCPLESR